MFCSKYGTFKHTNSTTNYLFHLSNPVMYLEVGAKLQGWGQAAGYQPRPQAGG